MNLFFFFFALSSAAISVPHSYWQVRFMVQMVLFGRG